MYHKQKFGHNRPHGGGHGGGRPQGGHSRHNRPASRANRGARFDINSFINKAVVGAETEKHFIPEHSFGDFVIHPRLKENIAAKGYTAPTPIQDRIIPHILNGRDVVGIANTGTGKTAAFLIPLINKVLSNPKEKAIIVVPTRELAIQIDQELKGFTSRMGISSVCLVGGVNIGAQLRELRYNNHFFIGTPGRLKDLINRRVINLLTINTVVLDEADRMLDMGFIGDMRLLMSRLPKPRHTLFFSATITGEVSKLIGEFLREPVTISVKTRETADNIDQDIVRVGGGDKLNALHNLLIKPEFKKVLIFGRTKHGVQKLALTLGKRGFKVEAIHGNKTLGQRQRALSFFKEGRIHALVATDVAARGLDIPNVSHVINYDLPETYEDYIHRIGRTGRGDATGIALTFV